MKVARVLRKITLAREFSCLHFGECWQIHANFNNLRLEAFFQYSLQRFCPKKLKKYFPTFEQLTHLIIKNVYHTIIRLT